MVQRESTISSGPRIHALRAMSKIQIRKEKISAYYDVEETLGR